MSSCKRIGSTGDPQRSAPATAEEQTGFAPLYPRGARYVRTVWKRWKRGGALADHQTIEETQKRMAGPPQ